MKRFATIFFAFTFIQSSIFADITEQVSISGTSVDGYLNASNSITVTVTLTGGDISTYNGSDAGNPGAIIFWVSFGTEVGEAAPTSADDSDWDVLNDVGTYATFSNNIASVTLTPSMVSSENSASFDATGKKFALRYKVRERLSSGSYSAVQPVQAGVTFPNGSTTQLIYDTDDPTIATWTYPDNSGSNNSTGRNSWPFKDKQIQFTPSEALYDPNGLSNGSALLSYMEFISHNGTDDGTTYKYNLVNGDHEAEDQTLDVSSLGLVSNSRYKIYYYIVDAAGNSRASYIQNDNSRNWWKYDATAPTLTSVSNILPSSTDSYGDGSTVTYDLTFSEGLISTGDNTVTYNNSGVSTITQSGINSLARGTTTINVSYSVDKDRDSDTDDLAIASFTNSTWTDSALNAMAEPYLGTFTGTNLSSGAAVKVDVTPPTVARVYANPSEALVGVYDASSNPNGEVEIIVKFSEVVTLLNNANINVLFNTSNTAYSITSLDNDGSYPTGFSYGTITYRPEVGYTNQYSGENDGELNIVSITLSSGNNSDLVDGLPANNTPNEIVNFNRASSTDLHETSAIQVDVDPPTVGSITSSSVDNGVYGKNAQIPIILNFVDGGNDEPISFNDGGSITVTMNTGGTLQITDRVADATHTAIGTYIVGSDDTPNGALRVSTIAPSSATAVKDDYSNFLADPVTVPATNLTNASYNNMRIDVEDPSLSYIDAKKDNAAFTSGTAKIGDAIVLEMTFSEEVKIDGSGLTITLNTDGTAAVSGGQTGLVLSGTYTVGEGESADVLDISTISLNDNNLTDNPDYSFGDEHSPNTLDEIEYLGFTSLDDHDHTIKVDGVRPTVTEVTTTAYKYGDNVDFDAATDIVQANNRYGINSRIKLKITFSEAIAISGGTIDLDLGLAQGNISISNSDVVANANPDLNNITVEKVFTVANNDATGSALLAVNGDELPDPGGAPDYVLADEAGNSIADAGRSFAGENISDNSQIYVDGTKPSVAQTITVVPLGGSAELDNSTDYNSYFNSSNTGGIRVTVAFASPSDATMEEGAIYLEMKVGDGAYVPVEPTTSVDVYIDNNLNDSRKCHRITGDEWTAKSAVIDISEALLNIANDNTALPDGQALIIRAYIVDNANNITATPLDADALTIDKSIPDLTSISYADPATTPARVQPYPKDTDIPIQLTFDGGGGDADKVTLIDGGTINIAFNVGDPAAQLSFSQSGSTFGRTSNASSTGTATYTVGLDEYSADALTVNAVTVSSEIVLRDLAGNPITNSDLATDLADGGFTNLSGLFVDGDLPDAPTITSITTDPVANQFLGNVDCNCEVFWNEDNDNATFTFTLATDASMENGKVYVLARTGSNAYEVVGDARTNITSAEASGTAIELTINKTVFDALAWWPTELNTPAVGDVDIKIRSEDYAGNTADTEDANKKIVHVDEIDPRDGDISDLVTNVRDGAVHSIAVQGYWNIDTDYLKVSLGDISGKDDNIVNGSVLLSGNISGIGWKTLGISKVISNGNQSDFYVEVGEEGEWGGTQESGEPFGVEELGNAWENMDDNDIDIKALVTDAAGNSIEYLYTNTFATTGNSTIKIDGLDQTDRPTVVEVSADKADGWWGPSSDGLPILIQIETTDPITVDESDGTPTIALNTGSSVTGSAEYDDGSGNILSFAYTPTTGETSQGNSTSGVVDGRLEFKLDNNGEAVITLNNGIMHEASGNLLARASESANPILPLPDSHNSLDGIKNIIIDGVAPYRVQNTLVDMTIQSIQPDDQDEWWTERTGYYNRTTDRMLFNIYYRYTSDDDNLDDFNSRVDMSLQTNDPSLDCNTATGTDCGTIQLKAEAVPSGDPIAYLDLGSAHSMTYSTLTNGENYPYEQIIIDANDFEGYNAVKFNGAFSDGLTMTFKAVITDLAGNQLETEVYGTPIIIDQTPPTQGTTGAVVANADNAANIVSGYWNSHNTGIQITAPLPDDATLEGGAVHILGKVTGAANYNYLGLYNVNSGDYDASYNITSDELTAETSTVPSPTTFLSNSIENWTGIEEITDYAEGAELTFTARVYDVAGNYTDWLPSATTVTVDETEPTVTEVTSLNQNQAYQANALLYISAVASEDMRAVGSAEGNSTLELAVGGGTGDANPTVPFRNVSNDTVYYSYTVSAGESSEDEVDEYSTDESGAYSNPNIITSADFLDYSETTPLVIESNGGALTDLAGNNLNTSLPEPGTANSLSDKKSIVIDTDDPGVTFSYFETSITDENASDALVSVNNTPLFIRATFTDSIQIDAIPTLDIDFPPLGAGPGDITGAVMSRTGIRQYDYSLTLIDDVDGSLIITPSALDKAMNSLDENRIIDNELVIIDNTEPVFTLLSPDSNSFVNNRKVSYKLSDDISNQYKSGTITWTRVSGNPDPNSPHVVNLASAELSYDTPYEDITLTNGHDAEEDSLVDGTYYSISWSAVDSADNTSENIYITTPVLYDTTNPNVQLTYSQYVAGEGYTDTITATFDERIWPAPQISVDYQGQFNDVSPAVNMTIDSVSGADSTVWFYEAVLPGGEDNNGTTFVAINATDLAGNLLLAANIFDGDTLVVDNSAPTCTLTYVNVNKPWLTNEGKGQDEIQVVATMSEKFEPFPFPQLNIQYSDSTNDSFVNLEGGVSSASDSTFTWTITLPDSIKNSGNMIISLNAKDRAKNLINRYFGESDFVVDNTPPDSFITGTAAPYGLNPKSGWINGITDSVGVIVPIPTTGADQSIFFNSIGGLHFELKNKNRGSGLWTEIPNAQEPFADSIDVGGQNRTFYRSMDEIYAIYPATVGLVQGDTIFIRAAISDRVGNKIYGDSSTTIFEYDPWAPTVSSINSGIVLTVDTLKSEDRLTAVWTGSTDTTVAGIPGSGILNYDYKIHMHDSLGVYMDTLIDWKSTALVEQMDTTLGLRHNRMYSVNIRAVDVAGNVSTSVISDTLYRLSSAPIITPIDSTIIWEDSLYTDSVQLTDLDLVTILGDEFTYEISWGNASLPTTSIINQDVVVDTNGLISWTPVATDTGKFRIKLLVTDKWGLKDSIVYPITIKSVNDRPVFSQLLPDTFFVEDQTDSFKINLTHYISDEDNNDSTEITWSAVIKDTTNRPGYPRMSLFFGPGTPNSLKDYLRQKYLPKENLIVSKTDIDGELKTVRSKINNKSMANKISIQFFQDNALRTFAYFRTDSNYHGADHTIKFIATDKKLFNNQVLHTGLTGEDSLLLTINPTNDRPQWTTIPIQSMYENDTMRFDPGAYVIDVDDTLLTFNLSVTTNSDKMTITPIEYTSHNLGDSITFIPEKLWSDFAVIQAIAKDAFNATDTVQFTIDVIRIPRPHITINVVQNNIFTHFYDILVTDTISKARNLSLEVQNEPVVLDTVGRHTFRGHHKFYSPGTYSIEVYADALVGDTTVFRSVGLVLARTLGRWSGASPDGRFHVDGEAGAVSADQSIMLMDSTMFKKGFAGSYKLGDEIQKFNDPVKVSMMNYQEDQAIYQRNEDNSWTELPSYYDQGRIVAYTQKMGYFRLGRKTLVVPGLTSLGQNYPNPFNPVTKITYDVGFVDGPQQHVNLSIYNLLGQHVQTLVDAEQAIGRHTVQWYGRDKAGMNVASGVYFMHMTTSTGKVQTKKVMLLR